jgi:predicted ATPase
LETLADRAERRQDYPEALSLLRRAAGMDALRDTTHRALMRVLAASGDAPAALSAYREYRLLLRQEMNVEPDAETISLYQQICQQAKQAADRRNTPTQEARPAPPAAAATAVTPPLPGSLPSALPHPLTTLLGRAQETREIADALCRSRLVTLVGGGGVGKTRLAIQVAREHASDFAQGVAFVALASLSDPTLLPSFVATALGIREESRQEPGLLLQALIGWFATNHALLVLDNCEHLIEAAASLTETLLEGCPNLRILATSRQRLGLIGEVAWRVPSLPSPDPERLSEGTQSIIETALTYPAIQLFVERAEMARPGFRMAGAEDAMAVARICHRLDGIPLAIELAAARVGALRVGQIASRLNDRFHLLTGGSRTALPRQQTLRALIDWSYDLLEEEEQALLCQLSVFAGGWTLEAAEAVTASAAPIVPSDTRDTLDLLVSLLDKSLVLSEEGEGEGEIRYRMLETIREYAREKLRESGTESILRSRHRAYFEERARAAARERAQLEKSLEERFQLQRGDQIVTASAPGSRADQDEYGDIARAIAYCQEEMTIYRELGNREEMAHSLHRMGEIHYLRRDYESARRAYAEALELFTSLPNEVPFAYARMNLGSALFHLGDPSRALQLYREALGLYIKAQNVEGIAIAWSEAGITWSLERIGIVEAVQGDAGKAVRLLGAACVVRERLGIPLAPWDKKNWKDWDEALDRLRARLTEAAFAKEFASGCALTFEQAIRMALSEASASTDSTEASTDSGQNRRNQAAQRASAQSL